MATNTINYNLKKPDQEDFYTIADQNGNMDIIDTELKRNANSITTFDTRLDLQERVLTATIPTSGWSGTAPYSVAVTVTGLTDSRPKINPVYSTLLATKILEQSAWNTVGEIKCTANTMTVYCFEEKPVTAINVEIIGG